MKEAIRTDESDLIDFHFTLGMRLRSALGLAGRQPELTPAIAGGVYDFYMADSLSQNLLEAVKERLLQATG